MHLGITVPNIWYMADLEAPGFHATGVHAAGNAVCDCRAQRACGLGFTALMGDVQDLYVEKLDGKGKLSGPGRQLETARRRSAKPSKWRGGTMCISTCNPLRMDRCWNPIMPKETRAISLKWTLYDPALNSLPLYQIDTAANWTEFSAALETWSCPRKMWSTPTTRGISLITPLARCRSAVRQSVSHSDFPRHREHQNGVGRPGLESQVNLHSL